MLLYFTSLIFSVLVVTETSFIWENRIFFDVFLLLFPFLAPIFNQIKIDLKKQKGMVKIKIYLLSKSKASILYKVFSVFLESIIIFIFELYIQIKISEILFLINTILLFVFPVLHFCLQKGKDFCVFNVFYGAIMSLIWSLWLESKIWDTEVAFFQKYILADGLKWIKIALLAFIIWEIYYIAKKHVSYYKSERNV